MCYAFMIIVIHNCSSSGAQVLRSLCQPDDSLVVKLLCYLWQCSPLNLWMYRHVYYNLLTVYFLTLCRVHGYVQQTHTHTHQPQNIGNNRPHLCALCIQCSLINTNFRRDLYMSELLSIQLQPHRGWLNQSRCSLGYWLRCAQGTIH